MDSRKTFRSVDEWKSAFMTLPDGIFYELVRSVLGNIKTPFTKQRLLGDLVNLLSKDETRKIVEAYIDGQDHKVIAAVAFLGEPTVGELEAFFAGEFAPAELHALVINLEERLILYRVRPERDLQERGKAGGPLRLALNPVLSDSLAPFASDAGPLFASYSGDGKAVSQEGPVGAAPQLFLPDDRAMAALFAFIQGEEDLFKAEAVGEAVGIAFQEESSGTGFSVLRSVELRKKVLDEWKRLFPRIDLELSIRILLRLGLLRQKGRGLAPCGDRMPGFCALPAAEREEYWAAGLCLCLDESQRDKAQAGDSYGGFRFSWNRLRRVASYIHAFRDFIDPDRVYPETTLRRFWDCLVNDKRQPGGAGYANGISPFFYDSLQLPFGGLLDVMEKAGFLAKAAIADRSEACWSLAPRPISPNPDGAVAKPDTDAMTPVIETMTPVIETMTPVIVMDSVFSFILYPEIQFEDAVSLGAFCSVKKSAEPPAEASANGVNTNCVSFEITRQSAVRGFDSGIKADAMIALLQRLSLDRLDASLGWTLREWESRYMGVSLYQGIVLVLQEDRRYLAEAGPVSRLILKTLAPGVYLLSSEEKAEATRALLKAGVDIVAQPPGKEAARDGFLMNVFTRLGPPGIANSAFRFPAPDRKVDGETGEKAEAADSIKRDFRLALEKKRFTKLQKDELDARIERRLILSEAQLEGASVRYEKLEARGLDYAGKAAIAKQAADAGFLVEVTWPGNHAVGTAQALEKKEGGAIFVFRTGGNSSAASEIRVPGDTIRVPGDTIRVPGDTIRVPGDTIRVPLGKISLLRRIKKSIFEE